MLPKPALPDATFSARLTYRAQALISRHRLCKIGLDKAPSCREIGIVRRERPYRMNVIGKRDTCIDIERVPLSRFVGRNAQQVNPIDKHFAAPIKQIDGEEPAAARNECTTIVRHDKKWCKKWSAIITRSGGLRCANPPYGLRARGVG